MGLLQEGDQLPTVKDVVAQVAINPNTVLKAYRWQYIVSGMMEPRFQRTLFGLVNAAQRARVAEIGVAFGVIRHAAMLSGWRPMGKRADMQA